VGLGFREVGGDVLAKESLRAWSIASQASKEFLSN